MYFVAFAVVAAAYLTILRGESGSGSGVMCESGDLRLVEVFDGGTGGRVEYCHQGEWGTVCDHEWDDNDAKVVCRQLGLPTEVAHALPGFGGGNGSVFIDNAACTGEEERLEECAHNGIGANDCPSGHSYDAGIFCDPSVNEVCVEDSSGGDCTATPLVSRSCLQRYGNCVPYRPRDVPSPCDDLYEPGVDYVYVPYQRFRGSYSRFMSNIVKFGPQLLDTLESCYDTARRVICHFYLPPCGNSTHFSPPTSVCSDTCRYLRELCPSEWDTVVKTFEQNRIILEVDGLLFLDCDNTGQYLSPLPHCCSTAGVNTSVTQLLNGTVQTNDEGISIVYAVVFPVLVSVTLVVVVCGVVLIVLYRKRRHQTQDLLISNPIPLGRIKGRGTTVHRYIEHSKSLEVGNTRTLPRVASAYVRQMAEDDLLIPASCIQLLGHIGQGEFGVVRRALLCGWKGKTDEELVAVKTMKGSMTRSELDALVEESLIMSQFDHRNVMKLVGVSIENYSTLYIVMPFMTHGSLLSYLRIHRAQLTIANEDDTDLVDSTSKKLLSKCLQIARGMEYLASQKFVHRDLAARNCMMDENFVIKVADFGLSEDIYARNYFKQGRDVDEGEAPVRLPVKWMALESLNDGLFSEKSDVWSFGVTCWEVFSLGKSPYPGVDPFNLIKYLERGERLDKPANTACSTDIYGVMMECWKEEPRERPRFAALVTDISTRLEEMAGYMDFNSLPLSTTSGINDT